MTESPWTPILIAEITRLWNAGLPAAEIGRRFGMTKNQVLGKAHRLELPERESPIDREKIEEARQAQREASRFWTGCRWIERDDFLAIASAGGNPCCGKPATEPGGSWCEKHRAIVFVQQGSRRFYEELADGLDLKPHQRALYVTQRLGRRGHEAAMREAAAA